MRQWVPAGSMLLVSLISYIDRNTLALLAPTILADCGLSGEQYGFIISAFSLAYMAGNPLWGRWLDKWGVRNGMLVAVAFWTAASASHAWVTGIVGFAVARAALGFGEGERGLMRRPPRPAREPILARPHWLTIAAHGCLVTAAVLSALAAALFLGMTEEQAVTVSFLTLATAQLWHVFDMRGEGSSPLRNDVTRNPWIWGALALCAGLIATAVCVPGLASVLELQPIGSQGWLLVLVFSVSPVLAAQLARVLAETRVRRRKSARGSSARV